MAKPNHLTLAQIREREERIWALSDRGKTTRTIATMEGISHQMVQKILDRVEARALKHMSKRIEQRKMRRAGQIATIIQTGFDQSDKSLEPRTQVTEKISPDGEVTKITQVAEQQGDTKWLYLAMAAMAQEFKLLGMEVLPASQEMADSISGIIESIKIRAQQHAQAKKAAAALTEGTAQTDPNGTEGMQGGPEPVQ